MERHEFVRRCSEGMPPELRKLFTRLGECAVSHLRDAAGIVQRISVVNNWRSAHGYALNTFAVNLRKSVPPVDPAALVAQRTKRLASITAKLDRFPNMKLTQMQDIGGCRAVGQSAANVKQLANFYQNTSRIRHKLASCDDYTIKPQVSGYRGIHLVYRCY